MSYRTTRRIAFAAILVPGGVALVSRLAIWAIPGCNPNPYALGNCSIGSANFAAPLLIGVLGGLCASIVLGVFVTVPLLLFAQLRKRLSQRNTKGANAGS